MWNNIVIEGFCAGEPDGNNLYPCGQKYPTAFCLSEGICPYFMYSESTERMAAVMVPLRLILWDCACEFLTDNKYRLQWIFWDNLWFNRRKDAAFFDQLKVVDTEDNLMEGAIDKQLRKDFPVWFKKAQKEGKR